jgi:hypothetical protein
MDIAVTWMYAALHEFFDKRGMALDLAVTLRMDRSADSLEQQLVKQIVSRRNINCGNSTSM